jgi:RNA polymerase sigma factor (sigma-70 family)
MLVRRSFLSDATIIRDSVEHPEAFSEVFDRHFAAVYAFISRRAAWSDPADLAGETFRVAFEARERYDPSYATALPWLYGIARNLMRRRQTQDRHRGLAHAADGNLRASAFTDPMSHAVQSVDANRDLITVLRALETEAPDAVEALTLHVWEGLSYDEIAHVLDLPIGTVRSRINRLRQRLRASLVASPGSMILGSGAPKQ